MWETFLKLVVEVCVFWWLKIRSRISYYSNGKVSDVNCLALDDSDVDYFLTQSYFLILQTIKMPL